MDQALPPMDRRRRLERLGALLDDQPAEALIVTTPENIRYLTGFTGSGWVVVRRDGEAALATDPRYRGRAGQELTAAGLDIAVRYDGPRAATAATALLADRAVVLLEADHITLARADWFREQLPDLSFASASDLVESLRLVKDRGEVARMARAGQIVADVFEQITMLLQPGMTELEIARAFDRAVEDAGGDGPSFDTLVASGPNASYPHWSPSNRVVGEAELILIDGGTIVDGYRSDVTRTFSFGDPTPEAQELLELARAAYDAVVANADATSTYGQLDQVARDTISGAGYGDAIVHPTGHNVGLTIHERPFLTTSCTETIGPNRVITVEPGVYIAGKLGARFEDIFRMTPAGAELLSRPSTVSLP